MELAKYVPEGPARDLYIKEMAIVAKTANLHTNQMLNLFTQLSFKQITEGKDFYVMMMFMQCRLAWLFKIDDPDFLKFYQDEILPMKAELKETFDQQVFALIETRLNPQQE